MGARRVQYGGCSFVPPDGFVIQEEASFGRSDTAIGAEFVQRRKSPLCVTLTSTAVHPEVVDFSESPEDMNPDAYPATLTLNTFVAHFTASALDYLLNTGEVLKKHFSNRLLQGRQGRWLTGSKGPVFLCDEFQDISVAFCLACKCSAGHSHNDGYRIWGGEGLGRAAQFCRISDYLEHQIKKEGRKRQPCFLHSKQRSSFSLPS